MIVSEWALNEKILIERFMNYCFANNGLWIGSDEEWRIAYEEWRKLHRVKGAKDDL